MKDFTTVQHIIKAVSANTGISVDDITSNSRKGHIVRAKQMVMWISRYYTSATYHTIAKALHMKTHANVIIGVRAMDDFCWVDKAYGMQLHDFAKSITK